MKIATFNVNGVNAGLPALLHWLEEARSDVVCLRELKAPDERFPGAVAAGDAARLSGRPGRLRQPLHRGRGRRGRRRLPIPAQRQAGTGPEVRL